MNEIDRRKLNSATKYPSIPTHHMLDPKNGHLLESGNPFASLAPDGPVYVTEKIDGTNGRIICIDDDWYIGSREELLTARGDRIPNPALGIVDALRDAANWWVDTEHRAYVYYVEVYGHRATPAWKTYGDGKTAGFRLFDIAEIPLDVLAWPIEKIAAWRDGGGQAFLPVPDIGAWAASMPTVPYITTVSAADLPADVAGMRDFMGHWAPGTRAAIDEGAATPKLPEGLVLRTEDRFVITKARFDDYDRTLRTGRKSA